MAVDIGDLQGSIGLEDNFSEAISKVADELAHSLSDMEHGIESSFGIIPLAAATAVAAIGAVGAAIVTMGAEGSTILGVEDAFNHLAQTAGTTGDEIFHAMDEGLKGTVDSMLLMQDANKILQSGAQLTTEQFGLMATAARELGKASGKDAATEMDLLSTALTTGRTKALQAQGVFVDIKGAQQELADKLGVTTNELSKQGEVTAAQNAIFDALQMHIERVGVSSLSFKEKLQQASVTVGNFFDDLKKGIASSEATNAMLDAIGKGFDQVFGGTRQDAINAVMKAVDGFANAVTASVPYVVSFAQGVGELWKALIQLNDQYQITSTIGSLVSSALSLIGSTLSTVINVVISAAKAFSELPPWLKDLAAAALLAVPATYGLKEGLDTLTKAADLAQVGWGILTTVFSKREWIEAILSSSGQAQDALKVLGGGSEVLAGQMTSLFANVSKGASVFEIFTTVAKGIGTALYAALGPIGLIAVGIAGITYAIYEFQKSGYQETVESWTVTSDSWFASILRITSGLPKMSQEQLEAAKTAKTLNDATTEVGQGMTYIAQTVEQQIGAAISSGRLQDLADLTTRLANQGNLTTKSMIEIGTAAKKFQDAGGQLTPELAAIVAQLGNMEASTRKSSTSLIDHSKVAEDAAKKTKAFREAMEEINAVGTKVADTIAGVDGAVVEGTKYYIERGVSLEKIATMYGLTTTQVKAIQTEYETEKKLTEALTTSNGQMHKSLQDIIADQMKIAQSNTAQYFKDWKDALDLTTKAQQDYSDTWQRLNLTDYEYAQQKIYEWEATSYAALDANQAATSDMYGTIANTAAIKLEEIRRKHEEELAAMTAQWPTWGNMAKQWIEDVPQILQQAFTGGGGLSGALSAIATDIGSDVGTKLGTSLASSMSGFLNEKLGSTIGGAIGSIIPGLGGIIGSLAGPLIDGFIGLFHKPEFENVMKDVGRDFGTDISEELGKAIAETEKVEGLERIQAVTLHLMDVINEAGGLTASNVEMFTGKLRDAFVYLTDGSMTVEQVTKTLDSTWQAFVENSLEGDGLISASLQEIIDLNDTLGTKSQAIAQFVVEQTQAGVAGLDALFKSFDSGITLSQDNATAFGNTLVAAFDQMRASGMSFSDALQAISEPMASLQAAMEAAGVSGSEAFSDLASLAAAAADPISGPLINALTGADAALKGLHNSNLLTQSSFTAITQTASEAAQKLLDMGLSGQQVGAIMQPTLQTIWELQQQFGYQVDATTQSMLDQAVAAGVVGEAHKSAQDRIADGVDRIVKATEGLARAFGVELPEAVDAGANAMAGSLDAVTAKSEEAGTGIQNNFTSAWLTANAATLDATNSIMATIQQVGGITTEVTQTMQSDFINQMSAADVSTSDTISHMADEIMTLTGVSRTEAENLAQAFMAAFESAQTSASQSAGQITMDYTGCFSTVHDAAVLALGEIGNQIVTLGNLNADQSAKMMQDFTAAMNNEALTATDKLNSISLMIQQMTGVSKVQADEMAAKWVAAFNATHNQAVVSMDMINKAIATIPGVTADVAGKLQNSFQTALNNSSLTADQKMAAMSQSIQQLTGVSAATANAMAQSFYSNFSGVQQQSAATAYKVTTDLYSIKAPTINVPIQYNVPPVYLPDPGPIYVPITYYDTNASSYFAKGGIVDAPAQYLAIGGPSLSSYKPKGSDVVQTYLTPGEGVVNLEGMGGIGAAGLAAINSGQVTAADLFGEGGEGDGGGGNTSVVLNFNGPVLAEDEYIEREIAPKIAYALANIGGKQYEITRSMVNQMVRSNRG